MTNSQWPLFAPVGFLSVKLCARIVPRPRLIAYSGDRRAVNTAGRQGFYRGALSFALSSFPD